MCAIMYLQFLASEAEMYQALPAACVARLEQASETASAVSMSPSALQTDNVMYHRDLAYIGGLLLPDNRIGLGKILKAAQLHARSAQYAHVISCDTPYIECHTHMPLLVLTLRMVTCMHVHF